MAMPVSVGSSVAQSTALFQTEISQQILVELSTEFNTFNCIQSYFANVSMLTCSTLSYGNHSANKTCKTKIIILSCHCEHVSSLTLAACMAVLWMEAVMLQQQANICACLPLWGTFNWDSMRRKAFSIQWNSVDTHARWYGSKIVVSH